MEAQQVTMEAQQVTMQAHQVTLERLVDINRALLDASVDGIRLVDLEGRSLLANSVIEHLTTLIFGLPRYATLQEGRAIADRLTDPASYIATMDDDRRRSALRHAGRLRARRRPARLPAPYRAGARLRRRADRPHHRRARDHRRARGRAPQVGARRDRLARAAHAAHRRPRVRGAAHAPRPRRGDAGALPPDDPQRGAAPHRARRRLPRRAEDRGRALHARARVVRARRAARAPGRALLGASRRTTSSSSPPSTSRSRWSATATASARSSRTCSPTRSSTRPPAAP